MVKGDGQQVLSLTELNRLISLVVAIDNGTCQHCVDAEP